MPRLSLGMGVAFNASRPTPTPTLTPTPTVTPTPTPIPAIPGIDTNYVQDIYLTNSDNPGMNGVWTNVSEGFGFPAWVNYLYSSYAYIFAPNNGYSGGESWTFYDTDQGEPSQPNNPSTNRGYIPTSGWTQNVSISAHTWRIADNNYLVRGLTYDDGTSYYSYPANGISIKRTPLQGATLYGDNGTFISYTAANGGTFELSQQIPYEESSFIGTLATKTGSPSARGIPAYGYTIGNPAQQYVTGNLIISPILYVPLSAASIYVSGLTFADEYISGYFYDSQPFSKYSATAWYGAGDDNGNVGYNEYEKRWGMAVYFGNFNATFAYNYASAVSGIPLSGWVMSQEFISVTGYPRITIEPVPSPTPTITPTVTLTVTPTRTPTPTVTPSAAAPSGIPVAGTNYVIISGALYDNGTYQKFNTGTTTNSDWILTGTVYKTPFTADQQGTILFSPGAYIKDYNGEGSVQFGTPYNAWTLVSFSYDGEYDSFPYSVVATNASTDVNYIPVNSWSPSLSVLSGTQIPVEQAAQLFIYFANLGPAKYNKLSNTNWAATYAGFNFNLSWNTYSANTWVLTAVNFYDPPNILVATNPSTDSTKIPTINWSYSTGSANVVKISYV